MPRRGPGRGQDRGDESHAQLSKAPQSNERGAMGSKNPPAYLNPWFSLLSMVLRALVSFSDPFPPMALPSWQSRAAQAWEPSPTLVFVSPRAYFRRSTSKSDQTRQHSKTTKH